MAARIESPRLYQDENLPTGPAWTEVQRLLAAVDTPLPRDIRNRAMLLLLACYGFRSSEVRRLRLADLDWEQGRIRLQRTKSGAKQEYPLTSDTAWAVLAYLQKVRPRSPQPEVFLTLKAPHRPLSAGALYHFTSHYFRAWTLTAIATVRMRCAMPVRPICGVGAFPSKRLAIIWATAASPPLGSMPRLTCPPYARWPISIWEGCYEADERAAILH